MNRIGYEICTICRKCISICEMLFLTCTEHTSTMSPELMKLRIIIISQNKNYEDMCVELRAKKL